MESVAYDQVFENVDFALNPPQIGEYEVCSFINCNFTDVDLCGIQLTECTFTKCNLTGANIATTAFRDARFEECKMVGLQFKLHTDFLFSVQFSNCNLQLCTFYRMSLKKMKFKNCNLREVDFSAADLTEANFDGCDLLAATFLDTNLEKADFRNAVNYAFDPDQNRIKKARFSVDGLPGLLQKFQIQIN